MFPRTLLKYVHVLINVNNMRFPAELKRLLFSAYYALTAFTLCTYLLWRQAKAEQGVAGV